MLIIKITRNCTKLKNKFDVILNVIWRFHTVSKPGTAITWPNSTISLVKDRLAVKDQKVTAVQSVLAVFAGISIRGMKSVA